MVSFVPKKITQLETLGEELRRARNDKNLNIDDVARLTQIRKEYLLALEAEDYNLLPSGLYGKNFLKKYASFLEIEPSRITVFVNQLESEYAQDNPFSKKVLNKRKFLIFPKIVRNIIISLVIFICFLYLIFYFKNIIVPPHLNIYDPQQNVKISQTSILIQGNTESGAEVTINEESILTDEDGYFSKLVNLKKGINTLEISSKKKYSRSNIITRQVLVE